MKPNQIADVQISYKAKGLEHLRYIPKRMSPTGRYRVEIEVVERTWRADPGDSLRPVHEIRKTWPPSQPQAVRHGPDVYLVPDGPGLGIELNLEVVKEHLERDSDLFGPSDEWNKDRSHDRLWS